MSDKILFCDMDRVLTDFPGCFRSLTGYGPEDYDSEFGQIKFWQAINDAGIEFWTEMKWMPGGKTLWQGIRRHRPTLLSAVPLTRLSHFVAPGKLRWIASHIDGYGGVLLCQRRDKAQYAEGNLLIDDHEKNCKEWTEAGGLAFQYHYKKVWDAIDFVERNM